MIFNSIEFLIFFPIVFFMYWTIPHKYKWILLFTSSYYFYMSWNPKYIIWIFLTTIISYTAARLLEQEDNSVKRKLILWIASFFCLGILFVFKYFNFFFSSIANITNLFSINLHANTVNLILPVGISFYTFQTLSYVYDVYNGNIKVEHHFGIYATFISFFPQLVAGPIERTKDLLPQIKKNSHFDYNTAIYGAKTILWGFFKKTVIADLLATYVNTTFSSIKNYTGFSLVIIIFFFSLQIYCDFSGYSDIAIGVAKLMGINLSTNFKSPYFSCSIKEFWSRWHISLSTWFKDYVYIPLGGNRCSGLRKNFNLMITFAVSGLWHGANWTFIIWGMLHGVAQIFENILYKPLRFLRKNNFFKFILTLVTFTFCNFTWIFFRANTLSDAIYVLSHICYGITEPINYLYLGFDKLMLTKSIIIYITLLILLLMIYDYKNKKSDIILQLNKNKIYSWIFYILLGVIVILFSQKGAPTEFVYFQF